MYEGHEHREWQDCVVDLRIASVASKSGFYCLLSPVTTSLYVCYRRTANGRGLAFQVGSRIIERCNAARLSETPRGLEIA